MSGVLVSVRSAAEAKLALAAGVDLIDVKEPSLGSLGAASTETIADVVDVVCGRVPVSVALGELRDDLPSATHHRGIAFAKLGLAGCRDLPSWRDRWRQAIARFPAGAAPVAVAYADWQSAGSPAPDEVLANGATLGCRALLIDTCDKSRGGLFAHLSHSELQGIADETRRLDLKLVLAGSLQPEDVPLALAISPDYLAFRGAACGEDRRGELRPELLAAIVKRVHAGASRRSARC